MKKLQIILCVLLLGSISVNAQKKKATKKSTQKIQFGVKAGGNISNINGKEENFVYSSKFGYYGGLIAKYPLLKKMHLQGEVYYNRIGAKAKNHEGENAFSYNNNIDYVSIPVVLQYKLSQKFYIESGPEFGVLISDKLKNKEKVIDMKDFNKKTILFWGIGTGYYFNEKVAANFRANIGIDNPFLILKSNNTNHFRMNNFQLGLVYFF